ncbi:hypothetical protein J45TS6_05450 [Paenibacillus sp. J45TS6]|nr:hypothetical protein J45TS6_05450 [Paenibacillus sp. J45TS6]
MLKKKKRLKNKQATLCCNGVNEPFKGSLLFMKGCFVFHDLREAERSVQIMLGFVFEEVHDSREAERSVQIMVGFVFEEVHDSREAKRSVQS